uniref:Uncharacterized protein n=1 Tax=Arundo donax TaxID=35708 RepID=A0A0A9B728_ARUDO
MPSRWRDRDPSPQPPWSL